MTWKYERKVVLWAGSSGRICMVGLVILFAAARGFLPPLYKLLISIFFFRFYNCHMGFFFFPLLFTLISVIYFLIFFPFVPFVFSFFSLVWSNEVMNYEFKEKVVFFLLFSKGWGNDRNKPFFGSTKILL